MPFTERHGGNQQAEQGETDTAPIREAEPDAEDPKDSPEGVSPSPEVDELFPETGSPEAGADTPTIDPQLMSRGTALGYSAEQMTEMGPEGVARNLAEFDRRVLQYAQTQATAGTYGPQPASPSVAPTPPATQTVEPFSITLNADDVDKTVIDQFNAMNKHYEGKYAQMEASMAQMNQQSAVANHAQSVEQFDRFISTLGDEWSEVIGKGASMAMQGTMQFSERDEIFKQGLQLSALHQQSTGQPLSMGDAWMRALHAKHFDKAEQIARRKLNGRVKRRAQQVSERPLNHQTAPVSPKDKAYRDARVAWRRMGR